MSENGNPALDLAPQGRATSWGGSGSPRDSRPFLLDPGPAFPTWTEARSLRLNGQGPPSLRLGAAGSIRGPLGRAGAPHPRVQECRVAQACRSRRGVPILAKPERDREAAPQRPPRAPALPLQPSLPFPPSPGRRTPRELPAAPASKGSMARAASSSSTGPPSSSASTPIFSGANRRAAAARSPRKPGPSLRPHACALERNGLSGREREKGRSAAAQSRWLKWARKNPNDLFFFFLPTPSL